MGYSDVHEKFGKNRETCLKVEKRQCTDAATGRDIQICTRNMSSQTGLLSIRTSRRGEIS
jgi:hypothetical protein